MSVRIKAPVDQAPDVARTTRRNRLRKLATRVSRAEAALESAIRERDEALIESHGDRRAGGLSYDELSKEVRVSKGRVIQIVQGNSDYSKAQADRAKAAGG